MPRDIGVGSGEPGVCGAGLGAGRSVGKVCWKLHLPPGGKAGAPIADGGGVNADGEQGFARFVGREFREDVAHRTDGDGSAAIAETTGGLGVGADAVDAEDVGLVLDGSRDQERSPVMLAGFGPAGAESEELGAGGEPAAEELGEAEVIADGGRDLDIPPLIHDRIAACAEVAVLAGGRKRIALGVFGDEAGAGPDDGHDILGDIAVAAMEGAAGLDDDAEVVGDVEEKAQGLAIVGGLLGVHGEAGVEHLGEDQKIALVDIGTGEEARDSGAVGGGVFPGDVKLQKVGAHGGTVRGSPRDRAAGTLCA